MSKITLLAFEKSFSFWVLVIAEVPRIGLLCILIHTETISVDRETNKINTLGIILSSNIQRTLSIQSPHYYVSVENTLNQISTFRSRCLDYINLKGSV